MTIPNFPLPGEHPMVHIHSSHNTKTIIKGNKTGLVALINALAEAVAEGQSEAETFRVGGDLQTIHIAVAETFLEISLL